MSGATAIAAAIAASPWAALPGLSWRPAVAAVASPMWQAVEWSNWQVMDAAGETLGFVKCREPDTAWMIDDPAAHAAARAAAKLGIAPEVLFHLPGQQAIGFRFLPGPWRGARLDDLRRPDILSAVIAARKAFRAAPALPRDWDVFVEIRAATVEAESTDMSLPGDCPTLLAAAAEIEGAITAAGLDRVPGHNDGQASNILLGPAGQVLLVDFDCAGQSDPYYDLAALLNEACLFEVDWRTGIAIHDGTCRDDVLNRCRVYGFADDLLWGLRGLVLSHSSPRVGLEFLKYGEWRLLRARMALRESGFRDRLHQL